MDFQLHLCKILYTGSKQNQTFSKRQRNAMRSKKQQETDENSRQRKENKAIV